MDPRTNGRGRFGRGSRTAASLTSLLLTLAFVLGQSGASVATPPPALSAGSLRAVSPAQPSPDAAVVAAAGLDEGEVSLDFVGAGPLSYDHATGVGGAYADRTIDRVTGVVESLEGGDFACGDLVVFFAAVTATEEAGAGALDATFTFDGETTAGSKVGFDDVVSASVNAGDTGNIGLSGNESVSIVDERALGFGGPGDDRVEATFRVNGVDGGEQIVLRMVVRLACQPGATHVTGNIQSTLDGALVVGGAAINTGEQTIPLKQAGDILAPAIDVRKSCPPSHTVGDRVVFSIAVSNTGNEDLTALVVDDPVLGGVLPSFGTTLAVGATVTQEFSYVMTGDPDPVVNTVTATATGARSHTAVTDTASCSTDVLVPDVRVTKVADGSPVDAGEPIGYWITVESVGEGIARDVVLTDELPRNDGLAWSVDAGTGAAACEIADGVLTCSLGDLSPGETRTVHLASATTAATCGAVTNVASVVTANDGSPTTGPVTIIVVCPVLGIQLVKDGPDLAHVGDTLTYTFAVSLTTPEPLADVVVTDPICDAGPSYVSGDDGDQVLEAEETWRFACDHVVTTEDPDPLPNEASVVGTANDGREATDADDHEVDLIHPAIEIVKTVAPIGGEPGDVVTYRYRVTNIGDTTLYDVSVDDDVLGHVGDIEQLAPGESAILTMDWTLEAGAEAVINVGTATGTDILGEVVSDEDDASVAVVQGTTPTPPPTAFTGTEVGMLGAIAAILVAIGLLALFVARRRIGER
ncbi:MAG TPA: hypothetical protein VF235_05125 [Actinomycetota bacterium]